MGIILTTKFIMISHISQRPWGLPSGLQLLLGNIYVQGQPPLASFLHVWGWGVPGGWGPQFCLWWRASRWKVGTTPDDCSLFVSKLWISACFHSPVTRCELNKAVSTGHTWKQALWTIRNNTECVQMRRPTHNQSTDLCLESISNNDKQGHRQYLF